MKYVEHIAYTIFSLSALLNVHAGIAQDGPTSISTERPTVGSSPDLIPGGSVQFENGAGISFQSARAVADLPETLLRVGVSDRAEVRYMFSDEVYQRSTAPHAATIQSQDPAVSVKLGVGRPNQVVPRSMIFALSLPTGGQSWTSGSYDPSLTGIWTQIVGGKYFVNEVAAATLTTFDGARRACWAPSVAGGRSLSGTVTVFGEFAPTVLPGSSVYVLDGGLALVHKRLTQFDMRAGYTKDLLGSHTLFSVGYSIRRDGFLTRFTHTEKH